MTSIALFHSVLGPRPGFHDAADRLRAAGHDVLAVDQFGGRVFDDYEEAGAFTDGIGFPALMEAAVSATVGLEDGFIAAGFSNGGGMAEFVATQRHVAGALLFSAALPLEMLGVAEWPRGVPVQIHYTEDDRLRRQEWIDSVAASVHEAGARAETFDYPGRSHLFADPSLASEYQPQEAEVMWERALAFVAACDRRAERG